MVEFMDGPAVGACLMLRRAPAYLRPVFNPLKRKIAERWDALDQLDDAPEPHEQLTAYRLNGKPTHMHLCMSPRRNSGWFAMAKYVVVEPQPDDATMRDTAKWRAWCVAQSEAEKARA